ncbi:MAG: glutamate--tRNA ligase [Acidithiobacillus ferrivorans]
MAQYYTTMNLKSRFAPSPTGYLHLGNARTALFAWLAARSMNGTFILRLEDTDQQRSPDIYEKALLADLQWFGIDWDEGPDRGGDHGPYRQMERLALYEAYYAQLQVTGQAYPCYCSADDLATERAVQRSAGKAPRYGGRCRYLSAEARAEREAAGMRPTLRFHIPDQGTLSVPDLVWGERHYALADLGDFVIRRSDGSPAFFFANAIDDALMGVNLVLRGEDHLTNTPRQILILQALDLPVPDYGHLPLLLGADGQPLSKRHGATSLRDLQHHGYLPAAVRNYLARLGHHYTATDFLDNTALAQGFALTQISKAPGHFDAVQLQHWQHEAVQSLDDAAVWNWLAPHLQDKVPRGQEMPFVAAVRANIVLPADALDWAERCFATPVMDAEAAAAITGASPGFWAAAQTTLQAAGGDYRLWTKALQQASGQRGKALFMPLRAALTGRTHGPELAALLPLIGAVRALDRLRAAAQRS